MIDPLVRMAKYVVYDHVTECMLWTGASDQRGYGKIAVGSTKDGSNWMARCHRLIWEIFRGPIPDGLLVRHSCDRPACVNIDHLSLGTHQDNHDDMKRRKRDTSIRGSNSVWAKITEGDVERMIDMHCCGVIQRQIAKFFGMSEGSVSQAINGITWKHVRETI